MLKRIHLPYIILFTFVIISACNNDYAEQVKVKKHKHLIHNSKNILDTIALDEILSYRVDTFFKNREKGCQLSGAYLVAKGNKVHSGSIGYRDYLNGSRVMNSDVFQLASVSKFITSLVILKLEEDKLLNLNDSVQKYFPKFTYRGITISNLLTHTSGLPEYTYLTDTAWGDDTLYRTNKDAINLLSTCGLEAYYPPNYKFNYCNSNFMILAGIAEKIINLPFREIVKKYITDPSGLENLHIYNPGKKISSEYLVKGMRGNHSLVKPHLLDGIVGDKSVYSNAWDLYLLGQKFLNNQILNSPTKYKILKPRVKVKTNQYYGFGIRMTRLDNGEIWHYHNGWWHGFRSYFWFNQKTKEMVVILTNRLKCGFLNPRDIIWLLQK